MQQNSESAFSYYVKQLLGLIGNKYENKYRLTNNFKGTGLKDYGCVLFSAKVHTSFCKYFKRAAEKKPCSILLRTAPPVNGGQTC